MPSYREQKYTYESESDSEDYGQPIVVEQRRERSRVKDVVRTRSRSRRPESRHKSPPEQIIINNRLAAPVDNRPRSSSTGGQPQPYFVPQYIPQPAQLTINENSRSRSRSHSKHKHRHHYSSSSSSESSRSRSRGRHNKKMTTDDMPYEMRKKLDDLERLQLENRSRILRDEDRIKDEKEVWKLEQAAAEREAKRKREEYKRMLEDQEREDERKKSDYRRKIEEQEREDERKKNEYKRLLEEQARAKKEEEDRKKAEYKRMLEDQAKDDQRKKEEYKRMLEEQKREDDRKREEALRDAAEKARKEDEKRKQILRDAEDKAKAAAEERKRIAEEERLKEAEKKRAEKEREERIILEHELKMKQKEKEDKELRERILAEEAEKKRKEDEKKKKEEVEFEERIRLKASAAGWSGDYANDFLDSLKGKENAHHHHRGRSPSGSGILVVKEKDTREKLIDMERPTWIRIHSKYILPETLNAYRLRWDYDETDDEYIVIKEYVDHDLQRDLFAHTKKIIKSRKLITEGYTKETTTTLKPNNPVKIVKNSRDEMYLVRKKSKSPAPDRRRLSSILF